MRSTARWAGAHSQKCANVVLAPANAEAAHNRATDLTVDKLNPPQSPSARSIG